MLRRIIVLIFGGKEQNLIGELMANKKNKIEPYYYSITDGNAEHRAGRDKNEAFRFNLIFLKL